MSIQNLLREPDPDDALIASIGTCKDRYVAPTDAVRTAELYKTDHNKFVKLGM